MVRVAQKHTLAVNQNPAAFVWSEIIRVFVSNSNEVAGIANICQGGSSPLTAVGVTKGLLVW